MHTASQLQESLFELAIEGRPATREELLVEWGPLHRFGVVVREPFGAIGASYLLQLAITAFYDARPERRGSAGPVYPDVFVFHVGGRFGEHAFFDAYPPRKEVFLEEDPARVLEAVNDRGITHLAVPDGPAHPARHGWKEPAQARDRIVAAWAYSAAGRAVDADVAITASSPLAEANAKVTLVAGESYHERQAMREAVGAVDVPPDEVRAEPGKRAGEVPAAVRERIWAARAELDGPRGRSEAYRRIAAGEALEMLGGAA